MNTNTCNAKAENITITQYDFKSNIWLMLESQTTEINMHTNSHVWAKKNTASSKI